MKKMFVVCAMLLAHTIPTYNAQAQGHDQVIRYIERYRSLAMSEQQRTGIPAAIKLAQAIHETGAGTSELAVQANNHFGLKCKSDWKGQTFEHNDDRRRECFRKYNIDFESYQDQSDYLKSNPRYKKLFKLSETDYAAWAFGLREAGYATNPQYAQRLIQLIEEYHLQDYTYAAMGKTSLVSESIASNSAPTNRDAYGQENGGRYNNQQPAQQDNARRSYDNNYNSGAVRSNNTSWGGNNGSPPPVTTTIDNTPPARTSKYINTQPRERQTMVRGRQNGRDVEYAVEEPSTVVKINNLKAVYGKRGDMPLQYAVRNNIRYEKFLEINDLEQDQPLPADMPLYLERKHFWGIRPMHLVKPGETMLVIAQQEGIQLKYLRDLNYMDESEEPMPGVTLELQAQAGEKPKTMKRSEALQKGVGSSAYASSPQPRSSFPKNPAPVYEEKNFFDKLKEKFEDSKIAEKMPSNNQQSTYPQNNRPQYNQNRQQQPTQQQQATAQNEPEQENQSKYLQGMNGNEQQTAPAQPQQQQPTQSYSRSQYSYSTRGNANANNNVTPNPAAQIYNGKDNEPAEEKLSRRERRKLEKEREEQAALAAQQAAQQQQTAQQQQPQQPKSELDKLKAQFDNVIYSENSGDNSRAQQSNQRYPQQTQQQPQQNYGRQQYGNQNQQEQSYGNRQQQQQRYGNQQYNNNQQQAYGQQQAYNNQQSSYGNQQQQYGNQQNNGYRQQNSQPQRDPSKFYTVQQGDTAYTIAKKHGITIRQLMDMNGLDFDEIRQGQELRVKL